MDWLEVSKQSEIEGTIFSEFCQILHDGKFVDVDDPVDQGEEGLDVMSTTERALFTLGQRYKDKYSSQVDRLHGKGTPINDVDEIQRVGAEVDNLYRRYDIIGDMFWDMVRVRLTKEGKSNISHLGLRSGFQIVSLPETKSQRICHGVIMIG